jgi:YidC/Oxa1 family membrane protein insertase
MDKRTVLAFVLIALVFFTWSYFFSPKPDPSAAKRTDSLVTPPRTADPLPTPNTPVAQAPELPAQYKRFAEGANRYVTIETPLYKATLNSRGGTLARFELKKFKTWYGAPVQLISDSTGFPGVLAVGYAMRDGKQVSTRDLNFTIDAPTSLTIGENDSVVVTARLALGGAPAAADSTPGAERTPGADTTVPSTSTPTGAGTIEKRFVFRGSSYGIGLGVAMQNMASEIGGGAYRITWDGGLKYQEHNSVDESSKARALVSTSEDLFKIDATSTDEPIRDTTRGTVGWVGVTSKYFGAALLPKTPIANAAVIVNGSASRVDSSGLVERYDIALQVPYTQASQAQEFTLFVGPLDHDIVSDFGLTDMVDMGFELLVRPIGEFFMLPFFQFLHSFIPNFGVVIIVFSLVIRMLLWPLSIPQIKSSRKMQLLQPKIAEIREKHKDDPQQQQMETMKVYREYGINPVGGCLPLILQLPILYALWATLSSAIDIRQQGFAFWIRDLSVPDVLITLPFSVPLLGNFLSGLALVMGATLFIQQKMMITDPKQKAMVYIMPVMLTLMFNHLPSGLNLYYLTFNLLAIGQQVYMTKYAKNSLTLEDLKRDASTKKKGWLSSKLEEAQKMAEMQQKASATAKSGSASPAPRGNRNGKGR